VITPHSRWVWSGFGFALSQVMQLNGEIAHALDFGPDNGHLGVTHLPDLDSLVCSLRAYSAMQHHNLKRRPISITFHDPGLFL
jgi:hypothetical protein